MTTTRTRISDDYIKPSMCPAPTQTRTRISGDYIKPSYSTFGRTVTHTPYYPSTTFLPIFSGRPSYTPMPSYPPVYHPVVPHNPMDPVIGILGLTILAVGVVALLALVPVCRTEEVCHDIGAGLLKCHLDRVCATLI